MNARCCLALVVMFAMTIGRIKAKPETRRKRCEACRRAPKRGHTNHEEEGAGVRSVNRAARGAATTGNRTQSRLSEPFGARFASCQTTQLASCFSARMPTPHPGGMGPQRKSLKQKNCRRPLGPAVSCLLLRAPNRSRSRPSQGSAFNDLLYGRPFVAVAPCSSSPQLPTESFPNY